MLVGGHRLAFGLEEVQSFAGLPYGKNKWMRAKDMNMNLRLRYGMESSCSDQYSDMRIVASFMATPSLDTRYLVAWAMHCCR